MTMPDKPIGDHGKDQWDQGCTVELAGGRMGVIKRPGPEHAARLAEIRAAVIEEGHYTLATPEENTPDKQSELARIERLQSRPGCIYLTCLMNGSPVGLIEFQNGSFRRTQHAGQLTVFVEKQHRGIGAGQALMQSLLEWARSDPLIEKVGLAVFSNNERAINLYEKLGFVREGYCPRDMMMEDGTYVDSVLMYMLVDGAGPQVGS